MLLIKTKIGPSEIEGIGLFAAEPIKKGTKVWEYNSMLDMLLTQNDMNSFSVPAQEQIKKYTFLDKKYNKYMLCGDDARFFNHSVSPNCDETKNDMTFALRDIEVGEELTVDYGVFYGNLNEHTEIR